MDANPKTGDIQSLSDLDRRSAWSWNSTLCIARAGTSYAGFSADHNTAVERPFFFTGKYVRLIFKIGGDGQQHADRERTITLLPSFKQSTSC